MFVLDRLNSIHSELVTLSVEANYGARGRVAVKHIVAAITEVHGARVHVEGQRVAERKRVDITQLANSVENSN